MVSLCCARKPKKEKRKKIEGKKHIASAPRARNAIQIYYHSCVPCVIILSRCQISHSRSAQFDAGMVFAALRIDLEFVNAILRSNVAIKHTLLVDAPESSSKTSLTAYARPRSKQDRPCCPTRAGFRRYHGPKPVSP